MRHLTRAVAFLVGAVVLSGCFGTAEETGSSDDIVSGADSPVQLTTSSPTVPSGGGTVTLTATVKNDNNVVREGVSADFSSDSGLLNVTQGTTDAAGQALAELSAGANKRERTITVQVEAEGEAADLEVPVRGNDLSISGPGTVQSTGQAEFSARLTDSSGNPISGVELSAETDSGANVSPDSGLTDSEGEVTFTVDGTTSVSSDTLRVEGFGERGIANYNLQPEVLAYVSPASGTELAVDTNHTVTVKLERDDSAVSGQDIAFTVSRGTLPSGNTATTDSSGEASVAIRSTDAGPVTVEATATTLDLKATRQFRYVGVNPDQVTVTSEASEIAVGGSTTITAQVKDAADNAVANATVNFKLDQDPSNGSLSFNSVTTGADGTAQTTFEAGSNESGTDGVIVSGTVDGTSISDATSLTVSGEALSVTLGTGNEIFQENTTDYEQPWSVVVKNSSGQPANEREVRLSVVGENYYKGEWVVGSDPEVWIPNRYKECANEDANDNNSLEAGEDRDGDGLLEPNLPVLSNGTLTTDSEGRASFRIIYPESEAEWVEVTLKATVQNSTGTAFSDRATFILPPLAADTEDVSTAPPGGQTESRYGGVNDDGTINADCTDSSDQ